MENNVMQTERQDEKKKITHIRVPVSLKVRLDKIRKDTGKLADVVNKEIIQLGIDAYYKNQSSSPN